MNYFKMHLKIQDLRGLREGEQFCLSSFLGGIQRPAVGQQPRGGFSDGLHKAECGHREMCNGDRVHNITATSVARPYSGSLLSAMGPTAWPDSTGRLEA